MQKAKACATGMTLINQKLKRGEVLLKNEHCNRYRSPTKNEKGRVLKQKQLTLSRPCGIEIKINTHRLTQKRNEKTEPFLIAANNSGMLSQRKPYGTKATTTLILSKKEVPPLPCSQRVGLCCRCGISIPSARNCC